MIEQNRLLSNAEWLAGCDWDMHGEALTCCPHCGSSSVEEHEFPDKKYSNEIGPGEWGMRLKCEDCLLLFDFVHTDPEEIPSEKMRGNFRLKYSNGTDGAATFAGDLQSGNVLDCYPAPFGWTCGRCFERLSFIGSWANGVDGEVNLYCSSCRETRRAYSPASGFRVISFPCIDAEFCGHAKHNH